MTTAPPYEGPPPATIPPGGEFADMPYELRDDGQAFTFVDPEGDMWLVPTTAHDFELSERLHAAGLSIGEVGMLEGNPSIRYPANADLVTLPAILNDAVNVPDGARDVRTALEAFREAMLEIERKLHVVPGIVAVNGIAINRNTGKAELLPPFAPGSSLSAAESFQYVEADAYTSARRPQDRRLVAQSFDVLHHGRS